MSLILQRTKYLYTLAYLFCPSNSAEKLKKVTEKVMNYFNLASVMVPCKSFTFSMVNFSVDCIRKG